MENHILCCDWGTSALRLKLVESRTLRVLEEVKSAEGIGPVFNAWERQSGAIRKDRYDFYVQTLADHIQRLTDRSSIDLSGLPIVLSGMASSSIGIQNVPYAELPFAASGESVSTRIIDKTKTFGHQLFIVSGLRSAEDVMRGEEIQFIGLLNSNEISLPTTDQFILVLPGTHSKHLHVHQNKIIDFKTFMTGEVFHVFSEYSILKDSISVENSSFSNPDNQEAFIKGVQVSRTSSLLHSLFTVRTHQLFDVYTKAQNYGYLSGLLIGAELNALAESTVPVVIASGEQLYDQYKVAAEQLSIFNDVRFIASELVERATVMGQVQVFNHFQQK